MKGQKLFAIVLAVIILLSVAGCGPSSSPEPTATQTATPTPASEAYDILYLVSWAGAEYFVNSFDVWKPIFEDNNMTLELAGPQEYSDDSLLAKLEMELSSQKYDAIVFYPITPSVYATYMQEYWDTYKIPIVCWGYNEDTGAGHYFMGNDYVQCGKLIGQAILDYVEEESEYFNSKYGANKKIPVAIARNSATPTLMQRVDSAWDVLEKDGRFEVVFDQESGDVETGTNLGETMLVTNPEVEIVIVQLDDVGLGICNALGATTVQFSEKIVIFGYDGTNGAAENIKSGGYFKATLAYPHQLTGPALIDVLKQVIPAAKEGKLVTVGASEEDTNILKTKDNVDEWFDFE